MSETVRREWPRQSKQQTIPTITIPAPVEEPRNVNHYSWFAQSGFDKKSNCMLLKALLDRADILIVEQCPHGVRTIFESV